MDSAPMPLDCWLLLGTNLGNREHLLQQAYGYIQQDIGPVIAQSSVYESEPWGFCAEQWFLNQVLRVRTILKPMALLDKTQTIERRLGRTDQSKAPASGTYCSRNIDIDILFIDQLIINTPRLTIPHPLLHQRLFTLLPMHQLAPQWRHPVLGKTIDTLLAECPKDLLCRVKTE